MSAPVNIPGLESLQSAFQANPEAFRAFVAGISAATLQAANPVKETALPAPTASTLADVLTVYRRVARISRSSAKKNLLALLKILERVDGKRTDPAEVSLGRLTAGLLRQFQDGLVSKAIEGISDAKERQAAMEKALRTSRSYIAQARSCFSSRGDDLLRRYTEHEGLTIPPNIREFLTCRLQGARQKKVYVSASADQFATARRNIEELRHKDPCCYIAFWLCSNALRAGDVLSLDWKNFEDDRNGGVAIVGLVGKNGKADSIPLQSATVAALQEFRRPSGRVVDTKAIRRLNAFLRKIGFETQKLSHELRAKILADVWAHNGPGGGPHAAQTLGRHSTPLITYSAYCARYLPKAKIAEVLV